MKKLTGLTGLKAIEHAEQTGATLHKHADAIDGAREVDVDEARRIAREDASFIWCAGCETTLADDAAPREARIAAAAHLCRAADDEQATESGCDMTWEDSAEQAGTIETMEQACGGKPSRDDWQTFGRYY